MDNSIGDQRTMKTDVPVAGDRSLGDARTMRPGVSGAAGRRFREGELLLGRYRVVGELGQGGMGVVYRCSDETAGIEVALKALPPEVARSSGEMEEVRANFRLVEKLHHPNIANVKTLERDPESGDCYLVMELVDGYDVRQWVRQRKEEGRPLTLDEVTIIAYRIAEALDYAHGEGVVHRDIKPSNVRVDFEGNVKVLDFGLAAQISTSQSRVSRAAAQGTGGTAPYMAPEQWRGRRQGAAADQYALAATVYELLEGAPPFEGSDPVILREAVLSDTPAPVAGAPEHVNAALLRALSKEPEARFASCGAFVKALAGKGSEGGGSGAASRQPDVGSRMSGAGCRTSGAGSWKWLWAAVAAAAVTYGAYRAYEVHGAHRAAESRAEASRREAESLRVSAGRREAELTEAARKEKEEAERLRLSAVEAKERIESEIERLQKGKKAVEYGRQVEADMKQAGGIVSPVPQVVPPRDSRSEPASADNGAAISIACPQAVRVVPLAVGQRTVYDADKEMTINRIRPILAGWQFVCIPRDTVIDYDVRVIQGGVLYAFGTGGKGQPRKWGEMTDTGKWSDVNGPINGAPLQGIPHRFCYRRTVSVGEVIKLEGFGLQLAAQSITLARAGVAEPVAPKPVAPSLGSAKIPDKVVGLSAYRTGQRAMWTNSLGMVFVPVPGTKVRFSIWDTRVQDYQAFVSATGRSWEKPGFTQGPTHPAVMVSWDDAKAFCDWLTEKERKSGVLKAGQKFRLPTDEEWSAAVGLENETGNTPSARNRNSRLRDDYPWGTQWPPPPGSGNFHQSNKSDTYKKTSPVGSFSANRLGLFDMGGNVFQWCEDLNDRQVGRHVIRGSSYRIAGQSKLKSSWRTQHREASSDDVGFRCVVED